MLGTINFKMHPLKIEPEKFRCYQRKRLVYCGQGYERDQGSGIRHPTLNPSSHGK